MESWEQPKVTKGGGGERVSGGNRWRGKMEGNVEAFHWRGMVERECGGRRVEGEGSKSWQLLIPP